MKLVRGTSAVIQSTVYIDECKTVADLTGANIVVMFKKNHNDKDTEALYTKTIGTGVVVVDAINGRFDTQLLASETNGLSLSYLYFEAQVKLASGQYIRTGVEQIVLVDNLIKQLI